MKLQQNVVAAWMRDTASSEAAETEDEPENVAHSDHIPAADPGDSTISETAEAPSNQAVTIVYRSEEHESTEGTEEMEDQKRNNAHHLMSPLRMTDPPYMSGMNGVRGLQNRQRAVMMRGA